MCGPTSTVVWEPRLTFMGQSGPPDSVPLTCRGQPPNYPSIQLELFVSTNEVQTALEIMWDFNHNVSFFATCFDITVGICELFQRISLIDNRLHTASLKKRFELFQI